MSNLRYPITVVGAGWAGLATAVKLTQAGLAVNLVEAASAAGGRARDIPLRKTSLDNGQHLMIGAYEHVLETLTTVGVDTSSVFDRQPLNLTLCDTNRHHYQLRANPRLPAPFHLLAGLFGKTGFSIKHRMQIARLSLQLLHNPQSIAEQRTVQDWLSLNGQDQALIETLWEPLCLATLNTPIERASARIFLRTLKDSFLYKKKHSDLLFARKTLSQLFVEPCIQYIRTHGGKVIFNQRVTELVLKNNKLQGLRLGEKGIKSDEVVLAIPPNHISNLFDKDPALSRLKQQFSQFSYEPIATVYLQYPSHVQLAQPMLGLTGTHSQWIFDRRICNQPGLMAVVISSSGPHTRLEREQLALLVEKEIASQFPDWPKAISRFAIREKRATFCSDTNVEPLRPENQSSFHGIWFAGDYTDTGYPATLEGAVKSGIQCAQQLIELYK